MTGAVVFGSCGVSVSSLVFAAWVAARNSVGVPAWSSWNHAARAAR